MNASLLWLKSVVCLAMVMALSACAGTPKAVEDQPTDPAQHMVQEQDTALHPDHQSPTDYRVTAATSDSHKCSCQTGTEFDDRSTCLCTVTTFTLEADVHCANTTLKSGGPVVFDDQGNVLTLNVVPQRGAVCQEPGAHKATLEVRTPSKKGKGPVLNAEDITVIALPQASKDIAHP